MTTRLYNANCLEVLTRLGTNTIDSIVTDPPYGIKFMGKKWDYNVPTVEVWEECLRVLKPGGYLLSFAGTRTYHRMVVNIEDAGFEIRDMIAWVYGSGFPKSRNVGKDVAGWDGWGTALKPAHEPIVVARKPFKGTVAANVVEYGTGGMNIDGCRVVVSNKDNIHAKNPHTQNKGIGRKGIYSTQGKYRDDLAAYDPTRGRWPANLIHDGSEEVLECFPRTKSGGGKAVRRDPEAKGYHGNWGTEQKLITYGDMGSAVRFFYCAKASKMDRGEGNNHPTVKPIDLMRYLCKLVTQPNGVVLDPFMGSGSTGKGALLEGFDFIGIEVDPDYFKIAEGRCR